MSWFLCTVEAVTYQSITVVTLTSWSNHAKALSIGFKQLRFIFCLQPGSYLFKHCILKCMWLCSRMDGSQRFAFLVFLCKATGIFHLWSLWTSTLPFRCCFHVLFQSVSHEWYFPCLPTEIVLGTEWASFPTLIKYRFTLSGCWRFVQKSQFLGVWGHLFSPSADLK